MKVVETFFTDNEDLSIKSPLGLPLYLKGKVREVYDLENKLLIKPGIRLKRLLMGLIKKLKIQ